MTDKKLTDNEVKKALECCYSKGNWCVSGCPRMYCCDTVTECRMELNKDAFDLINRLQAENERLKENLGGMVVAMPNIAKAERHEAYKEFAERLCEDRVVNDPVVIAAICLLKELVGDTE